MWSHVYLSSLFTHTHVIEKYDKFILHKEYMHCIKYYFMCPKHKTGNDTNVAG